MTATVREASEEDRPALSALYAAQRPKLQATFDAGLGLGADAPSPLPGERILLVCADGDRLLGACSLTELPDAALLRGPFCRPGLGLVATRKRLVSAALERAGARPLVALVGSTAPATIDQLRREDFWPREHVVLLQRAIRSAAPAAPSTSPSAPRRLQLDEADAALLFEGAHARLTFTAADPASVARLAGAAHDAAAGQGARSLCCAVQLSSPGLFAALLQAGFSPGGHVAAAHHRDVPRVGAGPFSLLSWS